MARFDPKSGDCFIFTFKEGLLSPIAHDLKIRVEQWHIEIDDDGGAVKGSFDPDSLRVVCAMKAGHEAPGTLSSGDKRKIEGHIRNDVLRTGRFTSITFEAPASSREPDNLVVQGQLTLCGRSQPLKASVASSDDGYRTQLTLNQPSFGIKPFRAMMGALKVNADVRIVLDLRAKSA